jgi:hypothetical protein
MSYNSKCMTLQLYEGGSWVYVSQGFAHLYVLKDNMLSIWNADEFP